MTINNVSIGDKFIKQLSKTKTAVCEVVDFRETKSLTTGKSLFITCMAASDTYGMGDIFEVAFTTVIRDRIT